MSRPPGAAELAVEINTQLSALPSRTASAMRAVRSRYSKQLSDSPPAFLIQLSLLLLKQPDGLCRFVAYELIQHHPAAFQSLRQAELLRLGEGLHSWSTVDGFACYLAGPIWRDGRLPDRIIQSWTLNPDRWWRRAALVSTVALSRRGQPGDVQRTIDTCAALAPDRDDMVVKALSWALRELAKKHPQKSRRFLAGHQGSLAARVVREVENKLATGLKNPRRRKP